MYKLHKSSELVDQPLGVVPAQTGIGDGFAVDHVVGYLLISGFDVALYHKTLDELLYIGVVIPRMHDLL